MTEFRQVQSSIKKYRFTLQNGMYFICEKALKIHKYTKFTPNGARNGAEPKKSHIFKIYGQFHCGIAHFQKEKDKSEVASHVVYENIMKNKKAKNICVKK